MKKSNSRGIASEIIKEWLQAGTFPDRLIETVAADRAFVMEVTYGVTRWKRALLWVVDHYASRPPPPDLIPYALTGFYQILFMDNVSEYAAVNETVQAAKPHFPHPSIGFLNGILRRACREKDTLRGMLAEQPTGIRLSHPDTLIDRWKQQFGEENTIKLCEWNNSRPQTTLRVHRGRSSVEQLLKQFKEAGKDASPHSFAPQDFIVLGRGIRVFELPGYEEGAFFIQDPATAISVNMLDPQPGENILDACAAPGGKTIHIAERMQDQGQLTAMDLYAGRLHRVKENTARMQVGCVEVVKGDASSGEDARNKLGDRLFDRILLDVPCTNTGVIRRRPDARWRFQADRSQEQIQTQKAILQTTASFLKPGGTLVYSTCSLEREENENIIEDWLKEQPPFQLIEEQCLLPFETQTDGAYAARLLLAP